MELYLDKVKSIINKNFVDVIKNQYLDFSGKTNFADFAKYIVIYSAISSIFTILTALLPFLATIWGILSLVVALGLLLPTIAIMIRRMRDAKINPWYLLFILIPVVGAIYVMTLLCADSEK